MSRHLVCAAASALIFSAGCTANAPASKTLSMRSLGASATVLVTQQFQVLQPGVPYSTNQVVRINFACGDSQWTAFAGPNPGQSQAAEITLTTSSGSTLQIGMGWIYAYGKMPAGQTQRVKAGASGTTIMVQHEGPPDGGTHRVFFIAKGALSLDQVDVVLDGNAETQESLTQAGKYFQIGPQDQEIPPELSLDVAPAEVKALVDYAQAIVQTANVE